MVLWAISPLSDAQSPTLHLSLSPVTSVGTMRGKGHTAKFQGSVDWVSNMWHAGCGHKEVLAGHSLEGTLDNSTPLRSYWLVAVEADWSAQPLPTGSSSLGPLLSLPPPPLSIFPPRQLGPPFLTRGMKAHPYS